MEIIYLKKIENENYKQDILNLLSLCDSEFVPSLSSRNSTTQKNLIVNNSLSSIPKDYFENLLKQQTLVCEEDGKVVAFMSFNENYVCSCIDSSLLPNKYITTVIVHPSFRKKGICGKFYDYMLSNFCCNLFTRTWSTNSGHTSILLSKGFALHATLKDDRGKGIDTVYFSHIKIKA